MLFPKNVILGSSRDSMVPPHLHGVTHFGENIEDEWFIVFLLHQLTKEFSDLIIRVVDSDGEFLLIEAADHLPNWANPETCEQRVYLYRGSVHVVPLSEGVGDQLSIKDAVHLVTASPETTVAADPVQKSVQRRIDGYPAKVVELQHQATVYVPAGVAALLKARPDFIAPAVLAFCNRDPIDMKVCRAMRFFPPENRVLASVKFTKCLYAMLSHHKFYPDRRTGWQMPDPNSPHYKAHSLGMKLGCGFEILVSQAKPLKDRESAPSTPDEQVDLSTDRGWMRYLEALNKCGYFKGLLEGSKEYIELFEKARNHYLAARDSMPSKSSVGQEVFDVLSSLDIDVEELKQEEISLPPPDDDGWLEVSPKALDEMMEERYGRKMTAKVNSETDPQVVSSQLMKFMNHISGLEGAEFPDYDEDLGGQSPAPVRPQRGIKKTKKGKNTPDTSPSKIFPNGGSDDMPQDSNKVSFSADAFSCAVQNILDFAIPEDNWELDSDDSAMSSYGEEVDMDLNQSKSGKKGKTTAEIESEIKQYMDQMDHELANTTIGESFEKVTNNKAASGGGDQDESFEDIENFSPVDINVNALKNILQSYQSQMGNAGPASNLLGHMGLQLDSERDSDEA
ncbi:protein ecdysoneless isoform X2 [Bacillus rossius redtenbacheri]|uniref:protein ecdysoneless isoform X2 n=1 Tax=Bacillus rossius redtenbacheri TaxID=93214 RepID=UPI002FDC92A4